MILGMSVQAFTLLHVFIRIAAIAAGFVVVYGMLNGRANAPWTALFLISTVLTSATGFLFPISALTPALATGLISSVVLAVALWARYGRKLAGAWRWIYVVTALTALYLNVLVLIVQAFQKVPQLQPLAPTQSEPAFLVAQSVALVLFLVLGTLAVLRFRPAPPRPA